MKLTQTTFFLGCLVGGMGAAVVPLLLTNSYADTKLLPFQGRLTDAEGNPVGDGARVVEFKLYDAPTGGNVKWSGEIHKLSVNGGLVNTMLGSKASLGGVEFASATFLQITVDANGDGAITAADPPLLPRQSVVPAVYAMEAGNSRKLNGHPAAEYESIFESGDPATGRILGSKIKSQSLPMSVFAPNSIAADQLAPGSVAGSELQDNSVTSAKIADGQVGASDLAPDVIARFAEIDGRLGSLEARAAALELGEWNPVNIDFSPASVLPNPSTTEVGFTIPPEIPASAKQILVFAGVNTGSTPQQHIFIDFYTKSQAGLRFAHSVYVFQTAYTAVPYNSSTFWLPMTPIRTLFARASAVTSTNGAMRLKILGYR